MKIVKTGAVQYVVLEDSLGRIVDILKFDSKCQPDYNKIIIEGRKNLSTGLYLEIRTTIISNAPGQYFSYIKGHIIFISEEKIKTVVSL